MIKSCSGAWSACPGGSTRLRGSGDHSTLRSALTPSRIWQVVAEADESRQVIPRLEAAVLELARTVETHEAKRTILENGLHRNSCFLARSNQLAHLFPADSKELQTLLEAVLADRQKLECELHRLMGESEAHARETQLHHEAAGESQALRHKCRELEDQVAELAGQADADRQRIVALQDELAAVTKQHQTAMAQFEEKRAAWAKRKEQHQQQADQWVAEAAGHRAEQERLREAVR